MRRLLVAVCAAALLLGVAAPAEASHRRRSKRPAPIAAPAPPRAVASVWDRLAKCESGGRWNINTGNGYYGGLQFNISTWRGVGGRGYPHQATKAEQIRRAEILRSKRGFRPWPGCSRKLGLR